MRAQKALKTVGIIFLIVCVIFIAIDIFKVLKININFIGMQSSDRISASSSIDEIRYEPTDYKIANKDEALDEIKQIVVALKEDYSKKEIKEDLFEIGNIHKIENLFYNYESYAVVKYKLLNIIEDLPKLNSTIKGFNNSQLKVYYNENKAYIEKYYGITDSNKFIEFAKSLSFLDNGDIKRVAIDVASINFDYDNNNLKFNIKLRADNDNIVTYSIRCDYYKSSDAQVKPYVKIIE